MHRVIPLLLLATSALAGDDGREAAPLPSPPDVMVRHADGRVTVRAVRIPEPIVLDGRLDDPYYRETPAIDGFLQQEPLEGRPATESTEAWIFFDDDRLYVSARLWDSAPDRIVANEMRRDHYNISRGASFAVVLDTFLRPAQRLLLRDQPAGCHPGRPHHQRVGSQHRLEHRVEREDQPA